MQSRPRNLCFFLPAFVVALLIDQATKIWIVWRFSYGEELAVIPGFFRLTHVRNPGGAFSFLATLPQDLRQAFFLGTGALAVVLLLVFLRRLEPGEWLAATAIGAVLGGAIGNLTDRVMYGEVIDFLDFTLFGGYVWPTFNVADCCIVVGVGVLMVEMFFETEPEKPVEEAAAGIEEELPVDARGSSSS
ncbi:MAG: signal peptidase II [Deltaproteobacteria bacterium]|nr:signal peptidase II [Deltaproteobacteria bacterium]